MKAKELIKRVEQLRLTDVKGIKELQEEGFKVSYEGKLCRYFVSKDFREEIKQAMERELLTDKDISKAIGYRTDDFQKFMQGKRNLPFELVERIKAILDI